MLYKNTKTGATIDSPCVISGGDWQLLSELEEIPEKEIQDNEKQDDPIKDEPTGDAGYDNITKAEIMQELDAFDIEYKKTMPKSELYKLMTEG